jgi:hypothetical protein
LLRLLVVVFVEIVVIIINEIVVIIIDLIAIEITSRDGRRRDPNLRSTRRRTLNWLLQRNRNRRLVGNVGKVLKMLEQLLLGKFASAQSALLDANIPEDGVVTDVSHDVPHIESIPLRCQLKLPTYCGVGTDPADASGGATLPSVLPGLLR